MVFSSPSWVPALPSEPLDSITIAEFMSNEEYGRCPFNRSRNPLTCGETGSSYSAEQVKKRQDHLARAIRKRLAIEDLTGSEWNRVVTLFSFNSIDYFTVTHAVHRLSGIIAAASAESSAADLEYQLRQSGSRAIFTCAPLLGRALKAAEAVGISRNFVFLLSIPHGNDEVPGFETVDNLITDGQNLPKLEPLACGTSGFPKAVKISHYNVISNVLQVCTLESVSRAEQNIATQVTIGILPFNHLYGLTILGHLGPYRGDEAIVQAQYNFEQFLEMIERFRIEKISVVPPILVQILARQDQCKRFDLSSVRYVHTGAAPLKSETIRDLQQIYPGWKIIQGYGTTETTGIVSITDESDFLRGSCGSLLPGIEAKIVDSNGREIQEHDTPGELFLKGSSVALGYLNNELATGETFIYQSDGRWIRTGDEVVMRKSPAGNEHLVVVDRIKELIKVKAHQVAPAELEACILSHPCVSDCAVIGVYDERAGEVPKAFVVKTNEARLKPEKKLAEAICRHVEEQKARYKWLKGGVSFVDSVPKSPSGKILRRLLRDQEKQAEQKELKKWVYKL